VAIDPSAPYVRPGARSCAARVAEALAREGCVAYFAGGCVRDRLLGIEPSDYDVATDARPEQIARIFPGARGVGASFGVMLVRSGGFTIEVATFRRDGSYVDGRRPERVEFGTAEQDAQRRDFTINGLFEEPATGKVIDFVDGVADITARRLRAIGSAEERLSEDRLRMLRAARFAARFDLEVDGDVDRAIRMHAADLMGVSRERVGGEVRRMLLHPTRGRGVELIEQLGLAPAVLSEPPASLEDARVRRLPPEAALAASLAAWMLDRSSSTLGSGQDRCDAWTRALVLSNVEASSLAETLRLAEHLQRSWRALDKAGRKRAAASKVFAAATQLLRAEDPAFMEEITAEVERLAGEGLAPAPLITGDDLVAMGLAPGPRFRDILERLYDQQLRGELPHRSRAIEVLRIEVEKLGRT